MRSLAIPNRKEAVMNDILNACAAQEENGGSKYPDMSYEQGVKAGIEWLLGDIEDVPLEPAEYKELMG